MPSVNRMGVLGYGNMAKYLFNGAEHAKACDARLISIYHPTITPLTVAPFQMAKSVADAIQGTNMVWLCVKPHVVASVCKQISPAIATMQKNPLFISIAAGISEKAIRDALQQPEAAVIRVMPNLPVRVGKGASGVYANQFVTPEQLQSVTHILNATGITTQVDDENSLHAVTGLSGSGTAYALRFLRDGIAAGVAAGLSEEVAEKLFYQTLLGAVELAKTSEFSIDELCEQVRSPKGTTDAALRSLDRDGFDQVIKNAVLAARDRSVELGAPQKPSGEPPVKKHDRGIVSPRPSLFKENKNINTSAIETCSHGICF